MYGYWNELVEFIRSLFNATFKTNPYLERAIMTGITRVSTPKASLGKESIFSDLNNLEVVTSTSEKYMNEVAMTTISFFDSGKKPSEEAEPERFYHGFVLGLIVDLSDRYIITSNRESGLGRYDVVIEPRKKEDDAIIMEFKVRDPKKETTLKDTAAEALSQIERKKYEADLEARGIASERIRKYGFAFEGNANSEDEKVAKIRCFIGKSKSITGRLTQD